MNCKVCHRKYLECVLMQSLHRQPYQNPTKIPSEWINRTCDKRKNPPTVPPPQRNCSTKNFPKMLPTVKCSSQFKPNTTNCTYEWSSVNYQSSSTDTAKLKQSLLHAKNSKPEPNPYQFSWVSANPEACHRIHRIQPKSLQSTRKHWDVNRLCPKISLITAPNHSHPATHKQEGHRADRTCIKPEKMRTLPRKSSTLHLTNLRGESSHPL